MLTAIADGLQSLATRMGTSADKASSSLYVANLLTDEQLENAFRTSWCMRKAVTIPALDAARKWREWAGEDAQLIEDLENDFRVKAKAYEAKWKARLYGGSVILIGVGNAPLSEPLDPGTVRKGDLRYLTVMSRKDIAAGLIEIDPREPRYGLPRDYEISTATGQIVRVHPSRLAEFRGEAAPTIFSSGAGQYGWDDSILQTVHEACRNLDATMANIASLVFDAKTDIIKIKGLSEIVSDPVKEQMLAKRFATARLIKGNNAITLLDGEEEYESKTYSFSGLDSVSDRFMQIAAGAADIPMTRFLGMSPAGMNATGDADLNNYHDRIQAIQTLEIQPAMSILDEVIVRSALGDWPKDLSYEWRPLKQMTEVQISEIRSRDAGTLKTLTETEIYGESEIAEMGAQMFRETGIDALTVGDDLGDEK